LRQFRVRFVWPARAPALALAAAGAFAAVLAPTSTQTAVANGDTRTISLLHAHTGETINATFRVNGSYDQATLKKLNWFLRDWRNDAVIQMDPRLFDVVWETHRGAGSTSPIRVNSAYRSPETNSMLRRRSRGVAQFSLHTQGKAMDIHVPDVTTTRLRETAIRMQRGGVGFYPSSGFVHLDVGNVRAWPRMRYDQLARLFPDGKTVHIASDGRTLPGYDDARVQLASRNGTNAPTLAQVRSGGFLASLFGWEEEADDTPRAPRRGQAASVRTAALAPAAAPPRDDSSAAAFFAADQRRMSAVQRAEANRPRGPTYVSAPQPAPVAAPVVAAAPPVAAAPANLPLPPRRPGERLVASLGPSPSLAPVPLPPQRPDVDRAPVAALALAAVPLPPGREVRSSNPSEVASLIGGAQSGRVARTPGLPPVITEGASPPSLGLLAYAPQPDAAPRRVLRQARTAPVAAQPVGVRAARDRALASLSPARLDRSNFTALTAPASLAEQTPSSALGATIAPLRAAARREAHELMFGPPVDEIAMAPARPTLITQLRPRP
jgi:uncharacterized protein YcbK (DUF882 family)